MDMDNILKYLVFGIIILGLPFLLIINIVKQNLGLTIFFGIVIAIISISMAFGKQIGKIIEKKFIGWLCKKYPMLELILGGIRNR